MPTTLTPTVPATALRPKLRDDLVITPQQTAQGSAYLVKDPVTGRFVRLRSVEHFVATRLDGSSSLQTVQRRAEAEFDARLPLETLEQFVAELERLGLLACSASSLRAAHNPGRIQGTMLHLRMRLLDPDRLLERLMPFFAFCFTPGFLVSTALLILLAAGIVAANGTTLGAGILGLVRPEIVTLGIVALLGITTVHEFAHGLTCKRFGGEVREMGFLLIYFAPAFYCNVSSAWQFAEKNKRLWVTFAGGYCELVCWALAVLCWRITQPDTWIHQCALIVMGLSGLRSFFNLNPLIKLDGYYLLSDWLDVPNLRQRAFAYVAAPLKRLFGHADAARHQVTPRLRRIYMAYGLAALVYSMLLLVLVACKVGGYLMSEYQGIGFVVFVALVALLARGPLWNLAKWPVQAMLGRNNPAVWVRKVMPAAVALAALLSLLFLCTWELNVTGDFEVFPVQRAAVRAEVEGFVQEVLVEEGSQVTAGQVLVRIADDLYRNELSKIEAQIREKHAELEKLRAGATPEEVSLARKRLETAEAALVEAGKRLDEARRLRSARLDRAKLAVEAAQRDLQFAQSSFERHRQLLSRQAVSREEFERAEQRRETCRRQHRQAQAEWQLVAADDLAELREAKVLCEKRRDEARSRLACLLAGARREDLDAAGAQLDGLVVQRDFLARHVERTALLSPFDGVVTTRKLHERLGSRVQPGDLVVEVQSIQRVRVEVAVPENEVGDAATGMPLALKARAYPERTFHANVCSVSATAQRNESEQQSPFVCIAAELENDALLLKPGMTGKAKVRCGKHRLIDLATRRLARLIRVEFWSWW
jgi:putative peptide zinc metalloprotease protein